MGKKMIKTRGMVVTLALLVIALLFPMTALAEGEAPWPSTNEANRAAGDKPYVALKDSGMGWLELEFVMPRDFAAVFEVRIDNAPPTDGDHWAREYDFIPDDEKVYSPYYVVIGESRTERITASEVVAVRHAAGAESDYYFNWVYFPVPVSRFDYAAPAEIYENEEVTIPLTFTNKGLSYEAVRFEFERTCGPGNITFRATDSNGVEHAFVDAGFWGPGEGFLLPADYEATTEWGITFSAAGDYTVELRLVDMISGETIVTESASVTVISKPAEGEEEEEEEEEEGKPESPEPPDKPDKPELPRTDGGGLFYHILTFLANIARGIAELVRG